MTAKSEGCDRDLASQGRVEEEFAAASRLPETSAWNAVLMGELNEFSMN